MPKLTTAAILFISAFGGIESKLRGHNRLSSTSGRRLGITTISGACTVANFSSKIPGGESELASLLGTSTNTDEMQNALDAKCGAALEGSVDLSDSTGRGPQFLKNFLDGGTAWNENYDEDISVLDSVQYRTSVFSPPDGGTSTAYPQYFSNFYLGDIECPLGAIECCYTSTRSSSSFSGNADICAFDMASASKSNHIQDSSITYYDTASSNQAFCTGFAFDKGSFGDAVKYNTLFHMAMNENLHNSGYVKNIPGAPLCGCVEQMPIVDKVDCIEAVEGYTINDTTGDIGVSISWQSCSDERTLKSYYNDVLNKSQMEKFFFNKKIVDAGTCDVAAESFMNDQMLVTI